MKLIRFLCCAAGLWLAAALPTRPLLAQRRAAAPPPAQVMVLGTFHFAYPGRDWHKTGADKQLDVLQPAAQQELARLTAALRKFRPTHVAVESPLAQQARTDSLYAAYVRGQHPLGRNETEQLGFRLAKELGLSRVWAIDDDGEFSPRLKKLFADSARQARFMRYYELNPDSAVMRAHRHQYAAEDQLPRTQGIVATLRVLNEPERLRFGQQAYVSGPFLYEETPGDYTGVDFETARWYQRNLRIFRNLRRLNAGPGSRVLVIIGAGHAGLLNYLLDCSPGFQLVRPAAYLPQ